MSTTGSLTPRSDESCARGLVKAINDPMQELCQRYRFFRAQGISDRGIAERWGVNPGLVANLGKKMEVEQPFWSQVLVEAVFPDQHWHLVQVAVCIGDDTAPPPLRIRPGKLYVKDCPICGQRFETRCSYRKYHPRLSRREIDRWRRQQKKLES